MQSIRDYSLIEKIHQRFSSLYYRARKTNETDTVIIELMDASRISASEIARIRHELEKIRALDDPHIVRISEVFDDQNFIAIVTEAVLGRPFFFAFPPGDMDLDAFFHIAETLTRTLGYIHSHGIVHQALTPDAVRYDDATGTLRLTGFGAAGLVTQLNEKFDDPLVIKTILPYMAPEQTGRINRPVDHRTDLYSLGILFYELLTGAAPFVSNDPMEIIHSHIAVMPPSPAEINPATPAMVSDMVMKLISKPLDNRYQSALGLLADVMECARQWRENGKIPPFEPGRLDFPPGLSFFGKTVRPGNGNQSSIGRL